MRGADAVIGALKQEGVKFISGAEELKEATNALTSADFKISFPDERATRLLRRGILMCPEGPSECSFVLLTPDGVSSVN